MYGKHWASMYTGSMQGAGSAFFAVWGYVISHMQPNVGQGTMVELNANIISFLIGEKPEIVATVIERMCSPDLKSSTKDEDGRKLVKIGEYAYRVVNGDHYRRMRNEQDRREYQKNKQAEYRARRRALKNGTPLAGYTDRDGVDHPSEDAALRASEIETRYVGFGFDEKQLWSFPTWGEAICKSRNDARCSRIDYWDGKDWTENVTAEVAIKT